MMKQALVIKIKGIKTKFSETFDNNYEVEEAIVGFIRTFFETNRAFPVSAAPFADIEITINPIEEEVIS